MVPFSLEALLAALDDVDGLALQVHQNFKPIYCTRDYARIFGFESPRDFLNLNSILEIVPIEHHEEAKQRYQFAMENGFSDPLQIKSQKPNGETIWIRVQDQLMHHGSKSYMLTFIEDISNEVSRQEQLTEANIKQKRAYEELKVLQRKLIEQEKIASLRNVVVGVAHEINTPLGVVMTSVSCIQEQMRQIQQAYENKNLTDQNFKSFLATLSQTSELMERNLGRTAELVNNFKLVATVKGDKECVRLNLASFISDIAKTYSNELNRRNIQLNLQLQESRHEINTYPDIWAHIVSNLINNAMEHGLSAVERGEISMILEQDKDGIQLTLKDNGVGMSEDIRKMAFDPFFTTKRGNTFTGLGLYITYNLVTQSLGGVIDCVSAPGKGCEFSMHIPVAHLNVKAGQAVTNA